VDQALSCGTGPCNRTGDGDFSTGSGARIGSKNLRRLTRRRLKLARDWKPMGRVLRHRRKTETGNRTGSHRESGKTNRLGTELQTEDSALEKQETSGRRLLAWRPNLRRDRDARTTRAKAIQNNRTSGKAESEEESCRRLEQHKTKKNEEAIADFAAGSRKCQAGQFRSGEQIRWEKANRKSSFLRTRSPPQQKIRATDPWSQI
jgi:hypothetical protein